MVKTGDGELYVEMAAVMSPRTGVIDGVRVTYIGRSKKMYMKVSEAIAWCEEEKEDHSRDRYERVIANLKRIQEEERAADAQSG